MSDTNNQDTPVAWMTERYWSEGLQLDTELSLEKPSVLNNLDRITPLYSSDQINRMRVERDELRKALEFYANPEIYRPHPQGPAFDRRDLSSHARDALTKLQDTSHGHE